jgi:hypothetical protein
MLAFKMGGRTMDTKRQRDPRVLMGLERMLLHWVSVMAFVTVTSMSLGSLPVQSVSERYVVSAVQFFWLPFALAGVVYSVWQYFWRQRKLRSGRPVNQVFSSGIYFLVLLVVANLASVLAVRLWLSWS